MYVPENLDEFIGQDKAIEQIRKIVAAHQLRGTSLPHILLTGSQGTGKTTLAKLIGREMGQRVVITTPSALTSNDDVFQMFNDNLDEDEVVILFIDEVHRLAVKVEEDFYLPMENRVFIRKGDYRIGYDMSAFTVIAATTLPGKISEPLRDRFGLVIHMAKYSTEEIVTILRQAAQKNNIRFSPEALAEIAKRARSNPRTANHLLDRCSDFALVAGDESLTIPSVRETFRIMGLDDWGLNDTDRRYLVFLYKAGRPVGVQSLIPILDLDKETIQNFIEPYLLEIGFISLTGKGRTLLKDGMSYVEGLVENDKKKAMKVIGGG